MERISKILEQSFGATSGNGIQKLISGRKDRVIAALETLITEGYVTYTDGPRNSRMHSSKHPYRQIDDPLSDKYEEREETEPRLPPGLPPTAPRGQSGEAQDRLPPGPPVSKIRGAVEPPSPGTTETTSTAPRSEWTTTTLGQHGKAPA
jgi:hypothetical protein